MMDIRRNVNDSLSSVWLIIRKPLLFAAYLVSVLTHGFVRWVGSFLLILVALIVGFGPIVYLVLLMALESEASEMTISVAIWLVAFVVSVIWAFWMAMYLFGIDFNVEAELSRLVQTYKVFDVSKNKRKRKSEE